MEILYFAAVSVVAVLAAIAVVVSRNTVHSALFLVVNLFCVAMLYLSLSAEFLAVVQITVYAGAIMVLFLFVITMLNPTSEATPNRIANRIPFAIILAMALLLGISVVIQPQFVGVVAAAPSAAALVGSNLQSVSGELFTAYLLPFELTSLLLLVAMVAAMVLGKRRA